MKTYGSYRLVEIARPGRRFPVHAGRKDRYMEMFKGNFASGYPTWMDRPEKEISWAMSKLKREDRVIWYLNQVRPYMRIMAEYRQNVVDFERSKKTRRDQTRLAKFQKAAKNAHSMYQVTVGSKNDLAHYISNAEVNGYRSILDFQFKNSYKVKEILETFESMEKTEEMKGPERVIEKSDEKEFLKFGDGWAWHEIPRESCEKEGKAMRHCGNVGSGRGNTILSLREPVKVKRKVYYKPHATFIYSKGVLGEMKGFANEKPGSHLYKYITALLKDDRIKIIGGGGYLPENNFDLNDLPDGERKALLKQKPGLESMKAYYEHHGMDEYVEKVIAPYEVKLSKDGKSFILATDTLKEIALTTSTRLLNQGYGKVHDELKSDVEQLDDHIEMYDLHTDQDHYEEILEALDSTTHRKLLEHVQKTNPDIKSNSDLAHEVYLNEDDQWDMLKDAFESACLDAAEAGASSALYRHVKSYVDDFESDHGVVIKYDHWDTATLEIPVANFFDAMSHGLEEDLEGSYEYFLDYFCETSDLYRRWSGDWNWDWNAGAESFQNKLHEESII